MEEKEKNTTSDELNTNNLFALASQEIEEEKRKENLENNKSENEGDTTSLEDLFKIEQLNNDNENNDSNFNTILNDNQNTEPKEDSTTQETNVEVNPFLTQSIDKADTESKEDSTTQETNVEVNPFFADKNIDSNNITNIDNPFFKENSIQLNETNKHSNNKKIDFSNVPHYNVKIEKKKPKKIKMLLGVLSYAIFIWLLLIGIALLIYVGNIKLKEMKGDYTPPKYNAYVVLTGSMLPKIKVEDVVVTKKVDAKDLKEGDIITFASSDERYSGTIITHRIKKKYYDSTTGKYTFQSKGDNNNVADNALVEEDNIYGKVILKIPKLGYLQLFLASKGGWILVILIPCAVVVSFDIVKLFKMIALKKKLKIVK